MATKIKLTPEEGYIDEFARYLLAHVWARHQVGTNTPPPTPAPEDMVFWLHAMERGWVSSTSGKVLAVGFKTAGAYLRR